MIDVFAQPYEALLLFHGGAVTGIVYLLLRCFRNATESRILTHVYDALFVLILFAVLSGYLYLANYGTVRGFLIVAFILGFVAVYTVFGPLFARIIQKIRKK